jgi:dolichyl-phosphate beta-glucosyltransferase
MSAPFLSLIVPAYNEAGSILASLADFQAYLDRQSIGYEIIVSADGNDGTRELVAELARHDLRLKVLGSPGRGGKGRGIRLAVPQARGQIIGFVDADNKTPLSEFDKILPWFHQGYDIVIGSRAVAESLIEVRPPLHRRLGSKGFALVMHTLVGLWQIHDTQCGFKFFRAPVARDLFARQRIDGYMFDVEILYLAQRSGYRLKEVGIRWHDDGDTRLSLVSGNWQNLIDLFRIRFGRPASRAASLDGEPARKEVA